MTAPARPAPSAHLSEQAVQRGLAELDELCVQHLSFVWRSLVSLGLPRDRVDDVAQEVFVIALRRAAEFRGEASFRTWLFGIASNLVREERRKIKRSERFDPLDEELPSREQTPIERLDQQQALDRLRAFLQTLDEPRRAVFILSEIEEFNAPEIAGALGVNLNTVYSRLRLGRVAFTRWLARQSKGKP
jgi:RNA polymerase sigma-70 factor (ECF subfamily)